jgi:hypothetical protein
MKNLKINMTSEVIRKDYEWSIDWNGGEISGSATLESSDSSLEINAFIDEDCLDGLTPDQVNEIESYVEENI